MVELRFDPRWGRRWLGYAAVLAVLSSAGAVSGAPPGTVSTPDEAGELLGSDTLNVVMDRVLGLLALAGPGNPDGYNRYVGIGSRVGEHYLEGSPIVSAGEPFCLPTDANGLPDTNPGCQEIAPMCRAPDSSICDDEESADKAQSLLFGKDGIVVLTDNRTHQRFADGAACPTVNPTPTPNDPVLPGGVPVFTDRGTGRLSRAGGAMLGAANAWKDVLRVLYTGCQSHQGDCAMVDRKTRCSAATNPTRQLYLDELNRVIQGMDCANGACPAGLRQAYRRDDSAGTAQVFAQILGVRFNTTARTRICALGGGITEISPTHTFCDGGHLEGFWPSMDGTRGDPITRPCAREDDLCGPDGRLGVVRAIRTPLGGAVTALNYPPVQCTRGAFARVLLMNTSCPICPDGTVPLAGACNLPYYRHPGTGLRDFNCLNDARSRPPTVPPNTDGRVYNYVMRTSDAVVQYVTSDSLLPQVAQWRQNMAEMDESVPVPGGAFPSTVCQYEDATRLIGCLVANTTCTLGFAGREAAYSTGETYDDRQEPLWIMGSGAFVPPSDDALSTGAYPFGRDLLLHAIGGFDRVLADCLDRLGGLPVKLCEDQVTIARAFYDMAPGDMISRIIRDAGFIPAVQATCVGSQGSAGCGAPTVQPKAACLP